MNPETAARKLVCKTVNLMSSGGGGHGVITPADLQAVFAAIEPKPLIKTLFEAQHQICEPVRLENMLVSWMFKRLMDKRKGMNLKYIAKNHESVLNASYEFSEGLAKYLARHRVSKDDLSPYFNIEKSKFSRYYAPFIRECIADLEQELNILNRQIIERTQDD